MSDAHEQPSADHTAFGRPTGNLLGLTKENFLSTFPIALRKNPSIAAMGDVTMEALAKRPAEISRLSLYPRVDELPEDLLDILAYDFKVDWWDPNYTLEEKRRVFKTSWYVHRHLGTKAAVETAIRAIYPQTTVKEWFEYEGGKPYHFKLNIDLTDTFGDETRPWMVLKLVDFYKSLRSHMEEIVFTMTTEPVTVHTGGGVGMVVSIGVPEGKETFTSSRTLHAGGALSSRTRIPVPADTAPPSRATILRTGCVCTIISNP